MSICRFDADSDVYVFYDLRGGITCCFCSLDVPEDAPLHNINVATEEEMLAHLWAHVGAGHNVPARAFERLLKEQAKKVAELKSKDAK